MSLDAHQEKGEGKGTDADIERAIKLSLDPSFLPQGQAPVGGVAIRDPVSETTPKLPEVVGKGKAIVTEEQVAHSLIDLSKKKRTTDQFILVRRDQAPHDSTTGPSSQPEDDTSEKVVHESSSTTDSERTESGTEVAAPKGDKEQGEVASSTVTSGVGISVRTEDQAGSDPGKAHEALAGPDPEPMQEDQTGSDSGKVHVSLAGPNPEHTDEEFLATAYPKVHENLKLITDEHVIMSTSRGKLFSPKSLTRSSGRGNMLKIGRLVWGEELIRNFAKKESMKKAFLRPCCMDLRGKLISSCIIQMVPVQVKTMKIQAGVKVSRPKENHKDIFSFGKDFFVLLFNTMAEQNVPAQAPTRTDEQIVPRSQWLQIGKSNLLFDAQKIQKNPIFQISVDILRNTNFFRAFSASASVPAVYIQQFWNSMKYDEKTGVYCCQVDEQWFNLSADLLRKALDITPVDPAHPFELPPTGDTVIDFVNQLGYPEPVEFVSNIRVNYVYQPWRAILTLINQCLTGKTSGGDKPRHPVLQMLWGIVTQTNVDHAELLWEEFTQGIQTFFSHKASHKASLKDPKKKAVPLLIPYGRFTKMIIYYLGSTSDVHKRPESPCHLPGDDFLLGNLKFISKGETDEVFGMAIPKQLITQAIQQSSYYPKYLEMVAKNTKKTPQDSASKQPEPATKRAPPKKPTTTTPVKPTKPPSSKQPKSPTKKPSKRKLPQKVRKGKPSFQLVDEDDEAQQEPVPQGEGDDPALELAKKMSLDAHQEKGEGEGTDADIERAIKLSLDPSFLPQGQTPVGGVAIRDPVSETTPKLSEVVGKAPHDSTTGPSSQPEDDTSKKVVHESSLTTDLERTKSGTEDAAPKGDKEQGEVASSTVTSGVGISVRTEDQAGSVPRKAHEALAGPDPKPIDHSFHRPSAKSGKMEQEMSEVKKTDHSAAVLALIKSHVPIVVDKYLGTKLDDALLRVLERHTADLIKKYLNYLPRVYQESKNQKRVRNWIKTKGMSIKKEKTPIRASGQSQPPPKDYEKSSKKPQDFDASASKQHPTLTSTGWQITDTRDAVIDSSMHSSEPESGHSEHSSDDVSKQDEEHVSDLEDTDNAHIPKVKAATWFKPIQEDERPATPEPEWTIPPNDFPEPENNWANAYATSYQVPAENKLQRKTYI
ncbi:hypothetical protein Tco_0966901 [Tanacetum coccineum]